MSIEEVEEGVPTGRLSPEETGMSLESPLGLGTHRSVASLVGFHGDHVESY